MSLHERLDGIRRRRHTLSALEGRNGRVKWPPNPAKAADIAAAERRLGFALPASYAAFLRLHDGWPDFAFGARLFGASELGKGTYLNIARMVVEDFAEDLEYGPPSIVARASAFVPFGFDEQAEIVFGWDGARKGGGDELRVVLWMNGLGETLNNFEEFLMYTIDMLDAEIEAKRKALGKAALNPRSRSSEALRVRPRWAA